eukprot:6606712-Pyramimonas_sp.AAC.1
MVVSGLLVKVSGGHYWAVLTSHKRHKLQRCPAVLTSHKRQNYSTQMCLSKIAKVIHCPTVR